MKVFLSQPNFHIGNFQKNILLIKKAIGNAKDHGGDLVIFPELAVCGYPPKDFLTYPHFLNKCQEAILEVAVECKGIAAIVGGPARNPGPGKPLFNAGFFLADGTIKKEVHKSLLPNYDVFDEYRYFEPGNNNELISWNGFKIALLICEDSWNHPQLPLYRSAPMEFLAGEKPDFMVNISASPFSVVQDQKRDEMIAQNIDRYRIPFFYVNHAGCQTELIFDGGSGVYDEQGNCKLKLKKFEEDEGWVEIKKTSNGGFDIQTGNPNFQINNPKPESQIENALVSGIRDYFSKMGFRKAILGLSGGIDSAVVLVLASRALGPENVVPVMLPSAFSSPGSVSDSEKLAENLGIKALKIPIEKLYRTFVEQLEPLMGSAEMGLTGENLQARIRGILLMALSNRFGYILLNTTNKSEMAVGYGTLYGDLCGGLSVLGDLYKTGVYSLAAWINREKEIIPNEILTKAPSAELRPGQKDSDSLPPYPLLDNLLNQYIEKSEWPEHQDSETVQKVLNLVNTNEYKRWQAPPVLRISQKSFGTGRRMPLVAKYD